MGRKLKDQQNRITQKSIGFTLRQHNFFAEHPDFKPDMFCRNAVDEQIKIIDPTYIEDEKETE